MMTYKQTIESTQAPRVLEARSRHHGRTRRLVPAWGAALVLALTGMTGSPAQAQKPRENIVEIPAIGEGLCVSNTFQSNMVLQRDKPISVWGWAARGEKVKVSFAGNWQVATANDDGSWKATLAAMPANSGFSINAYRYP